MERLVKTGRAGRRLKSRATVHLGVVAVVRARKRRRFRKKEGRVQEREMRAE
jgi:hypothetical protein